jgi:ATP-dependent Clp protease ATP-binding subunit ClpA
MFERFARAARTAVEDARFEAERRGDRRIGSDHLLLALLRDDDLAELVGVNAAAARDVVDELDRAALAAIGVELGELESAGHAPLGRHVALMTPGAKAVIQRSLANAAAQKARAITSHHVLLALLDGRQPDPAATLLAALPIDQSALRERLGRAS